MTQQATDGCTHSDDRRLTIIREPDGTILHGRAVMLCVRCREYYHSKGWQVEHPQTTPQEIDR